MRIFRDYMESALYDPEHGFYTRRTPTADFYTAPELHPAFAGVLARKIIECFARLKEAGVSGPYTVCEMGSGSGALARQLLAQLPAQTRYILVERSRSVMIESLLSLRGLTERPLAYERLEDVLPFAGVFLSNELVDAFPVHILGKQNGKVGEIYVDDAGQESVGVLSNPQLQAKAQILAHVLEEGQRHAVNLEAPLWLASVAGKLKSGFIITIDYGRRFPETVINSPRAYRRHQLDERLTHNAGSKDLTASVDFEMLIKEGEQLGLSLESFSTLSHFLIDGGIEDWLNPAGEDVAAHKSRTQIKTLIHPDAMGETFKVLIQAHKMSRP